jgi:tRNA(fMet)-specific endonuclease VapC
MKFLLDTDILSYIAREASAALMSRMQSADPADLALSVVSRGEIEFGLAARPPKPLTLQRLRGLLDTIPTLPLGPDAALHYGRLRAHLQGSGTPIGANDLWIAAHALAGDRALVTNNEREFKRVPKLRLENWLR